MNLNCYVPDGLIPILVCFPSYETSCKFSLLFYENYRDLPQHKVLFNEYVVYTGSPDESSPDYTGYKLGSFEYKIINGTQKWRKNGLLHRENDLPACIWANGMNEWYKDGQLHRENDLPACMWA